MWNSSLPPPPPGPVPQSSGPNWAQRSDFGGAIRGGGHLTKEKGHQIFRGRIFRLTPGPKVRFRGALEGGGYLWAETFMNLSSESDSWKFRYNPGRDTGNRNISKKSWENAQAQ